MNELVGFKNLGTVNTNRVDIGPLRLYFSYETCVAFHLDGQELQVCENIWSKTTGKLLNSLADKQGRLPRAEFLERLNAAVSLIQVKELVNA